jgi:hypothetical protein
MQQTNVGSSSTTHMDTCELRSNADPYSFSTHTSHSCLRSKCSVDTKCCKYPSMIHRPHRQPILHKQTHKNIIITNGYTPFIHITSIPKQKPPRIHNRQKFNLSEKKNGSECKRWKQFEDPHGYLSDISAVRASQSLNMHVPFDASSIDTFSEHDELQVEASSPLSPKISNS